MTKHREDLVLRVQRLAELLAIAVEVLLGLAQRLFGAQALGELVLERASALLKTRDLSVPAVDAAFLIETLGWNDPGLRSTNSIEGGRVSSAREVRHLICAEERERLGSGESIPHL